MDLSLVKHVRNDKFIINNNKSFIKKARDLQTSLDKHEFEQASILLI